MGPSRSEDVEVKVTVRSWVVVVKDALGGLFVGTPERPLAS